MTIASVVANVTDDEVASVTVAESAASTDVTEAGPTDTYTVVLDLEPSGTVTVTLSPDADVSVNPNPLTFTTSTWNSAQTVTVTGVDDAVVEGGHTGTITHSASGGSYDGATISNVVANVTDDEVASVTVTESAASTDVTEGGATDTYTVVLDLEPSGTVTVTLSPDSDVSVSPNPLTFTTGNWSTAQTTTVTAVNDAIVEGGHTGTVTHSASGGGYDGVSIASVVANVTDNDTGSVTVTESAASTDATEGGATDTYTVVLDLEPSGTVTVTLSPDSDVSVSPNPLTFTTSTWSSAQTVTVTGVDDAVVEGGHTGTITHSASGGGYDGVAIANVVANVTDNDTGSVTVTESGGSTDVTEGGATDTYTVVLDLEPSGAVTVTLSPDSDVSVSPNPLTFTTSTWSLAQTVTVTGVDDAVVEGGHTGTITHSASSGGYDGVAIASVVANVTDDDTGSVTVTETAASTDVTEGGATDTYTVVLDLEPSGTVTVTLSPDSDVSVSPNPLTFTTSTWSSAQTVTVTGVDDAVVEGGHTGTITHSASGGSYDGASISNVVANITDKQPSVTLTESGGSTDVTEGGATDTYSIVLDAQPTSTVTVTLSPDSDVSVSPNPLTFTTGNWSTAQTTTVTAVNDAILEGGHTGTITHSASGGGYDGVSIANAVANVTDNDTGSVTVTESAASTDVTEGGATDTYSVVLDVAPSGTVTVTPSPDSDVSVSPNPLTFTTENWSTAQTTTLTAVNDAVVEGSHTGTVTHSASGGGYDGVSIANVLANVTDDDTADVTITESGGSTDVTEAGPTDTYTVVLDLEPSGTVTVTLSPDADVSVSPNPITFTTGNWSSAQTITVTAIDDAVVEGAHTGTITHSASGGAYDGASISNVVASITDKQPSVTITESGGSTDATEGGATDTYSVVLDAQPTSTVTVTLSPDSDVSVSPNPLTFTTGNWSTAQTTTVTAVDDAFVEGAHTGTVTHSASGGGYDGVSIASLVANITDNDAAGNTWTQLDFRWYDNIDAVVPSTPLAAENTDITNVASGDVLHVRMNIDSGANGIDAGSQLKLQYSTAVNGPWSDIGGIGSGELWRGYDNPGPADGAGISTVLLASTDSGPGPKQTYEEVNNAPGDLAKNKNGEWGWVVQQNGANTNTTYYFRLVEGDNSVLSGYTNYPQLTTEPAPPGVTITPNNSSSGNPEDIIAYTHTVTNTGDLTDTFDIAATSSEGWTVALFEADGTTPLTDTDSDTVPDTGAIAGSGSVNVVVKITLGWSGLNETTTVFATSSLNTLTGNTATDITTATQTLTITLSDTTLTLGTPDPGCQGNTDGTTIGEFTVYNGTLGGEGCAYVWDDLTVTVKSNAPWSGTIVGADNSPTSEITVALGSFRYDTAAAPASYSDCAADTALPTSPSPFEPSGVAGVNAYTHRYCARVDWDDSDGSINSTFTYSVSQ